VNEFLQKLPQVDAYFKDYVTKVTKQGKTLRMGAAITVNTQNKAKSKVTVGILEVATDHPLFSVKGGENAFVFTTNRYSPIPLSIRGYGAGAGVTAAGVFGDILRTVSWTPIRRPLR
jgi:aspartokinase/homoserine dehydrogenase 1